MSQSIRTRLQRVPKTEEEIHIITNPSDNPNGRVSSLRKRQPAADYQAPMTSYGLRAKSHWLIVRRNLHRIRFMGYNERERDETLPDFYLGLQMKRELKRAQEEIKHIDQETHFHPVKKFNLALDAKRSRIYDTSHVQPNDALIYDRLGEEPLALQNLLYYFSKQDVSHGTIFWDFLNEVNRVINMRRKRTVLVQRLKTLALTLAVVCYVILGIMFFLMIAGAISTISKMNDPEIQWIETDIVSPSDSAILTR